MVHSCAALCQIFRHAARLVDWGQQFDLTVTKRQERDVYFFAVISLYFAEWQSQRFVPETKRRVDIFYDNCQMIDPSHFPIPFQQLIWVQLYRYAPACQKPLDVK